MNRSSLLGIVAGVGVTVTAAAVGGYQWLSGSGAYAEVVDVRHVTKTVQIPRQVCHDEAVTRQKPVKDEHRVAGTVVGAVIGGVVGNQLGGGRGKTLTTVAGAAAGGYAGNQVQDRMQKADTYTTTEQRCETVYDRQEEDAGYKVTYNLNGKTSTVRMDHDPGRRIPVRDGKLVLDSRNAG